MVFIGDFYKRRISRRWGRKFALQDAYILVSRKDSFTTWRVERFASLEVSQVFRLLISVFVFLSMALVSLSLSPLFIFYFNYPFISHLRSWNVAFTSPRRNVSSYVRHLNIFVSIVWKPFAGRPFASRGESYCISRWFPRWWNVRSLSGWHLRRTVERVRDSWLVFTSHRIISQKLSHDFWKIRSLGRIADNSANCYVRFVVTERDSEPHRSSLNEVLPWLRAYLIS